MFQVAGVDTVAYWNRANSELPIASGQAELFVL